MHTRKEHATHKKHALPEVSEHDTPLPGLNRTEVFHNRATLRQRYEQVLSQPEQLEVKKASPEFKMSVMGKWLDAMQDARIPLGEKGSYTLTFDTSAYRAKLESGRDMYAPIYLTIKRKDNATVSLGQPIENAAKWLEIGKSLNTDQIDRILNGAFPRTTIRGGALRDEDINPNSPELSVQAFEAIAATNSALPPLKA
jgi:hypothetical protein